jgi:predicted ATPase
MTGPDIPAWAIPTAKTAAELAWRNRNRIAEAWTNITRTLRGRKSDIAFTGAFGTGKSVLLDHLSGKAFDPAYTVPEESLEREIAKVAQPYQVSRALRVTVLRGQETRRLTAVNEVFHGPRPADGLVHGRHVVRYEVHAPQEGQSV